jgi:polyisoprenoid-binding protein YceI
MRSNVMKSLTVLATTLAAQAAFASNWDIDAAHARTGFLVKHMSVTDVYGGFKKFSGKVVLDEKDISKSSVTVEIDPSSIDTGSTDRDNHLKSPDFFDAGKFPKITFKSTKVEKVGTQLKVTGDLTIKDITKPVVLTVDGPGAEAKNPFNGAIVSAVKATGVVNRKDFGMTFNKVLETGGVLVGEEVTLQIDAELVKQAEAAPAPAAAPAKPEAKPAKKK